MHTLDGQFDLIFIDGDHKHAGAKADFEDAIRLRSANGHIIAHDTQCKELRNTFDEVFGESTFFPGNKVSYGLSIYPPVKNSI
jgi:hypothetical protein